MIFLSLLVTVGVSAAETFRDADAIYDGVVRLHILAASDGEKDQADKLAVRDAILASYSEDLNELTGKDEAKAFLSDRLEAIEALAKEVLISRGGNDRVEVTLTEEYYPTRDYESMRLPAGEYLSLRVILGEGEGHNWWCMVYPPLCTSSASADEELAQAGFSKSQVRLLTDSEDGACVMKFKIVETAASLWETVKGWFS